MLIFFYQVDQPRTIFFLCELKTKKVRQSVRTSVLKGPTGTEQALFSDPNISLTFFFSRRANR